MTCFESYSNTTNEDFKLVSMVEEIMNMFGIDSNIKLLGLGSHGIVFGIGNGSVLKITTDMNEFNSASLLIGKKLPNVMSVLRVAKSKDANIAFIQYPEYTMFRNSGTRMSKLFHNSKIEDSLIEFIKTVACVMDGDYKVFEDFNDSESGNGEFFAMIKDIKNFLKSVPMFLEAMESPQIRMDLILTFLRLGLGFFGNAGRDLLDMIINDRHVRDFLIQIMTGIEALRKSGIMRFRDLHSGNIAYQDGRYILIDLGAGGSYSHTTGYQISEIARMNNGKHV